MQIVDGSTLLALFRPYRSSYHTHFIFQSVKKSSPNHPPKSVNFSRPQVYLMCGLFPHSLQFSASSLFHYLFPKYPAVPWWWLSHFWRKKDEEVFLSAGGGQVWSRRYLLSRDNSTINLLLRWLMKNSEREKNEEAALVLSTFGRERRRGDVDFHSDLLFATRTRIFAS